MRSDPDGAVRRVRLPAMASIVLLAALAIGTIGCADDFSLTEAELRPGLAVVKPDGWILSVHPEGGYELLSTRSGRVRKIGIHVFSQQEIAAAAGEDDPDAEPFATTVVERYRQRIRDAVAKRRGFPAPLLGYFDAYGEQRCDALVEHGLTWRVCRLRRPDAGHPSWYNLYTTFDDAVVLVTAFAARAEDGAEELSRREQRALLESIRLHKHAS